jgi:ABC-type glycerol-3-phosphate transport system substrate-binding protein
MSTSISGDERVWGIPVRCDVRMIWYWQDMLERVKVDPVVAFKTPANTQHTLERLKTVIPNPWGVTTTFGDPNIIQTLATWLWASKSDFINAACDEILLMKPESLDALRAYYGLHRYMPKDNPELSGADLFGLFAQRKLAAIVGGPWARYALAQRDMSDDELARIGIAVMPGPPFVGGTVLSIWRHSRHIEDILKLIEYLLQPEVQLEYCPQVGLLPTRHTAWKMPAMANDPYYKVIYQSLSMGRGLPAVPLWGMIEEKLKNCFSLIWKDLLANPDADVEQTIHTYLAPTVTRLNMSLK